jgi:hypothetical protein
MAKVTSDIGELNTRRMVVSFVNNGTPTLPSTAHWRLTCPDEDSTVVDWTAVTPTSGTGSDGYTTVYTVTVDIPATAHAMQTDQVKEQRLFIVSADKGLSTEFNEEWSYYVVARQARS